MSSKSITPSLFVTLLCPLVLLAGPDKPEPRPLVSTDIVRSGPVPIQVDLKNAKELFLVVTDAGDSLAADWANWIDPVIVKTDGSRVKLAGLKPKIAKAGWGKVGIDKNAAGDPMLVKGQPVTGIGTHAPSVIGFDLPEGAVRFEATAAIDKGGTDQPSPSAVFQVFAEDPTKGVAGAKSLSPSGAARPYGFEAAKATLAGSMKVAAGLEVSLLAAEPKIQNPTNIEVDHRGRIWATEAVNYRSSFKNWGVLRPEGDRVVILEDTNGDGVSDTEKTFWQSKDLQAPLGICVLPRERGTQVIVAAAPNVWLLTDKDGDDVAETAVKIFKVGGNWDHDHEVHAFVFGPDGKFYFNFGNEGKHLAYADGTIVKDLAGNEVKDSGKPYRQGMVFRCDLDLETGKPSNIETLGHNFRNNYEVCVDSFGTLWQSDNDDDGNKGVRINYVMEFGNYGFTDEMTGAGWRAPRTNIETEIPLRHWHLNDPGVVPNLLQTGSGSPTGILINEGTLLGPQFTNQLIHCDAGPRVIRAYPVQADGAGYKASMVNILESTDEWYRPADVAIAPDGSLIAADWYDAGVGGHNMADHTAGQIRGRVYRVAPAGAAWTVPKVDLTSAAGAVAALQSPNGPTRFAAWQKLRALGTTAEPELVQLFASPQPRLRARALGLLAYLPGRGVAHLTAALQDKDADIRIAAVRLSRTLAKTGELDTTPIENSPGLVEKLVRDPNPQVRRQIAISLAGSKDIAGLWAALAKQHDGKDRWYLEALGIGAIGNEDACFKAWSAMVGEGWDSPAGRDIVWRLRSSQSPAYLSKVLTSGTASKEEFPRYLRAFDFLPESPDRTRTLVQLAALGPKGAEIASEALERLKSINLDGNEEVKQAVMAQLLASRGTSRFVELVRDFKLKDQGEGLLEVAMKDPASPAGIEATRLLLNPAYAGVIAAGMKGSQALRLVEALGNTGDKRANALLQPLIMDATTEATVRKQAVRSLAQSDGGVLALLALARNGEFPADLRFTATAALSAVQMPKHKAAIAELFPAPNALGAQPLPPIAELVKKAGNAVRGKELFAKEETSCTTCHRVGQLGADFGPALAEIGSKLPKEALFESIIDPNAGVSMGFETTQLTMKNGDAAVGVIRSETESEVVLGMPRGIQNTYKKSEIGKREKLPYSLMPSGLQQMLSAQDLVDMVEYLASLKTTQATR